jgi:hypothetical protein
MRDYANEAVMEAIAIERHYSVQQIADMWNLSAASVRRLFEGQPGVIALSMPRLQKNRKHKPHVLLRIPASVVKRLHEQWSAGFRLEVKPGRRIIK